ncbi:hypothetical protein TIFTF001_033612 [Ficus carica]|uniref:Uncharacterized protein n=1 Tax=Ficus carica TaxID=3494 RepID=A0AA88DYL4_FICCA|nr:hypothetical protein TIFTF001_033612 [Ficus carica]
MNFPDLVTLLLSIIPVATDRLCQTEIVPMVETSLAGSTGNSAKI